MKPRDADSSPPESPSEHRSKGSPDPRRCVICGQSNDCALAREGGDSGQPCWCTTEVFPKNLVASISRKRGQTQCLCMACLEAYRAGELDVTPAEMARQQVGEDGKGDST